MKKIYIFIMFIVFFCSASFNLKAQQWEWARKINSVSTSDKNCIVVDSLGNYYLATSFGGPFNKGRVTRF